MRTVEDLGREIDRRWVELGVPGETPLRVIDLPQRAHGRAICLGVGPDGSRLLVPLNEAASRRRLTDTKSSGIQLRMLVHEGADSEHYLDVICPRTELRWLFSTFVADILLRVERAPGVSPESIVVTCFEAWRALFSGADRRLSPRQLTGLFGELTVLERLLERDRGAARVWRGPLREPHDFRGRDLALEAKTTVAGEDEVVQIHGLEQLVAPGEADLVLMHLRVEMPAENGVSVPQLVERLLSIDTSGRLRSLLAAAGYFVEHADSYEPLTFKLIAARTFSVDDAFPRLSPQTWRDGAVPVGLGDFRYTLDLGTVSQPPLVAAEADACLDRVLT